MSQGRRASGFTCPFCDCPDSFVMSIEPEKLGLECAHCRCPYTVDTGP